MFRVGHIRAAKLTPDQVQAIRQRYAAGETQGALAREYRVALNTIGRIVRNEAWQAYAPTPTSEPELQARIQQSILRAQALIDAEPTLAADPLQQVADAARRTATDVTERALAYGARKEHK